MKMSKPDEVRKEYMRADLGKGTRGKYFNEYKKGTNLILLSPDVAAAFPDDNAVNNALRSLLEVAERSVDLTKLSNRRAVARG